MGNWNGIVARALASHQCVQFPDPASYVGLMLTLILHVKLAPRVNVLHRVFRFSTLHKNQHFSNPIRPGNRELLR